MAETILVNGVGEILKVLISVATQEIDLAWGVKEDLEKLRDTLTYIQALVQDAEKQQVEKKDVRELLRRLKEVAYEAEDVLDEFYFHKVRLQVSTNKVCPFSSSFINVGFRLRMAHKIKDINKKFDEIKRDLDFFKIIKESVTANLQNNKTPETFAFVADSEDVIGREDDKLKIRNKLISSSDTQEILSVLTIVGMGGLGKTTLAKLVYNDDEVTKYFDSKYWVHVSTDFELKKILIQITEAITRDTCQISSLDVIQQNLREKLNENRFLLVLDDVWNCDAQKWDMLKTSLSIGSRGSKIIATTRSDEVASIMGGSLQTYHLQCLIDDECLTILKNKAFGNGGIQVTPEMEAIGMEIAKKCEGLPLAAKALGGIMRKKIGEKEWESIKDSEIWACHKDEILPALKLSYDHMPSYLKQCFLYCSIFPKGEYIFKDRLIKQWMALGFLHSSSSSSPSSIGDERVLPKEKKGAKKRAIEEEDIGNDYFNELLWHSFFQDIEKDDFGDIIKFKMHGLVFDLAQFLSKSECVIGGAEELKNNSSVFHLRLSLDRDIKMIQKDLRKARNLRSLHLLCTIKNPPSIDALHILFKRVKRLRVLEISNCGIKELPSSIKILKHLRYLNLMGNPIEALPESITCLYNLLTLNLYDCPLKDLPREMRTLVNLRQLLVNKKGGSWSQMPLELWRLSELNELESFIVGQNEGQSINEIQYLELRNFLSIYNLENVRNRKEAEEAELMKKKNLVGLGLSWGSCDLGDDKDDVLQALQPHSNLKKLSIRNYGGVKFPGWIMSTTNLVKLYLHNCEGWERVPPFGQLPFLKVLSVKGMKKMKSLGTEFYHGDSSSSGSSQTAITVTAFPSLEEFSLGKMPSLEEWVEPQASLLSFPRLERISIEDCPELKILPSQFPLLKLLKIKKSNGILPRLVVQVPSLTKLFIDDVSELKFLPQGLLHDKIQEIDIRKCPNFEAVIEPVEKSVQKLPSSLALLNISDCPSLMSLPDLQGLHSIRKFYFVRNEKFTGLPEIQHFRTLEFLSIGGFSEELESFPNLEHLKQLASLRTLVLIGWSKLTSLPDQLQSLTQLEYLGIHDFHEIESLPEWLWNLSSLRTLRLKQCKKLKYLRNERGLRCITALYVEGCPFLVEGCTKGRRKEWSKNEHIQFVQIDGQVINPLSLSSSG
ncbi:putative disease resistance protein At3g14460 [Telopea speciosissima]|uniref:putative disease resistance protein At3g14460 n=1 Tax=Telopea speciosissima TaxID=54955 RepID=UPI001CC5E035|nr:putative disease resistance protein At3g14460 [Telopea speciosissima]